MSNHRLDPGVANPGAALGEAIGGQIETELGKTLEAVAKRFSYEFSDHGGIHTGGANKGRKKRLIMKDAAGIGYNIDGVVRDAQGHPVILFESKYIRDKKHNRDKGSWICTAHSSLMRTYPTIRRSIAVLAGSWSESSKKMIRSFGINILEVPFDHIVQVLKLYSISFDWGERERHIATHAWVTYCRLMEEQRAEIGGKLVANVRSRLEEMVSESLDPAKRAEREIEKVEVVVYSSEGEINLDTFQSPAEAISHLKRASAATLFSQDE
jgi:hypothetical protein